MQVAFRVDASSDIGTGHVMRCLTLAHALAEQGASCEFICRAHGGHLIDLIREQGFAVHVLPLESLESVVVDDMAHAHWLGASQTQDAQACEPVLKVLQPDWLVVDHYGLDCRWEQAMRQFTGRIMAIDDLADRPHDCDLLLDQNLGRQPKDYDGLLSSNTQTLIGPAYALLRPEFAHWRERSLKRRVQPQLKNLIITMGGVDQTNATGQVLDALTHCELPIDLRITVVMGPTAPWLAQVLVQAAAMPRPTLVLVGVSNMAQLMAENDLCIGAAGSTSWERCCLGLPALQIVLAANQEKINEALELAESALTIQPENLEAELPGVFAQLNNAAVLCGLSKNSAVVCDGLGAAKTVQWLEKFIHEDHPALQ